MFKQSSVVLLAVLSMLSALSAPSRAQAPVAVSSASMSLASVLDAARRSNPEIRVALKRWDAARKRTASQATPDKPRLGLERMYAPAGQTPLKGAPETVVSLTQEFPFPTTLYLRGSRASKAAEVSEQVYRAKVREVLAKAQTAYAMLYLSFKSRKLLDENIELMRRFAKVAESKYAAGAVGGSDAMKAQVELTKMLNMGVAVDQEKELASAMLNAAMGRSAWESLGTPRDLEPGRLEKAREELEAAAFARRPELRGAALAAELSRTSLALARSEFLPDVMVGYRRRTDPMRGRTSDAMLGLSLPLWFWKPAAMVAEAAAEKEMAEAELETARLTTAAELRTALVRVRTAQRLAESYKTSLLPQAESALSVAESSYQAGKAGFLDLLDAQRSLLNFKLEYYEFLADYERRVAELERVVGEEL
ncbi:MAG: TolC family protein [Elusimicrobia bacterium]|nr:TolC family protein [Elusimicrobiota bacterium]